MCGCMGGDDGRGGEPGGGSNSGECGGCSDGGGDGGSDRFGGGGGTGGGGEDGNWGGASFRASPVPLSQYVQGLLSCGCPVCAWQNVQNMLLEPGLS